MTPRVAVLLAGLSILLPGFVAAQDFPDRPLTMVVPFPPGGVADQTARPTASAMERILKQPVVVANRAGAAGAVGNSTVANARADGYTILMALSSISVIPEADKLFDRQPAYRLDQLSPLALITADPTILVVPADSPWKTLAEFVDDAKKRPGEIAYSSSGVYGTLHLAMEMFASAAGVKLKHVPFNGAGPAVTAILGSHVQALASGPGVVIPQIEAGKLRALANWGATRIASMADVPTFRELGYKNVEFYIWAGLFAPAKTPPAVMTKLRESVRDAVKDPEFLTALGNLKTPLAYKDAPEFERFFADDAKRLAEAVKRIGKVE